MRRRAARFLSTYRYADEPMLDPERVTAMRDARADSLARLVESVGRNHVTEGPACSCGLTAPCPTRRTLDQYEEKR